jgi:hypothetical protein
MLTTPGKMQHDMGGIRFHTAHDSGTPNQAGRVEPNNHPSPAPGGSDSTATNSFTKQGISRKTADAAGNRAHSLG